mgnify:CR=1 FL=1
MTSRKAGPRLGKWWAHLKRRVLFLPQLSFAVEVDFCPLPDIVGDECCYWLGLVAHHQDGSILLHDIDQQPPNLDSIARLLGGTMECAHPRPRCRPETVFYRDDPEWQAMVPYLNELGITTIATEELSHWDERAKELIDWMQEHWSTWPKTQLRPAKLPIPESLYDLREMSHWFQAFQRRTP